MTDSAIAHEGPRPDQLIMQIGTGYILSAALHAAVKLGVADQLSAGPRHVGEVARAVNANEGALYRILRALASVGVFTEASDRVFALTPAAELLRTGVQGGLSDLAGFITDPFHFRVYAEALYSVRTGESAGAKVVGMPVFEYLVGDKEESESFNNAMTSFSATIVPAVLDAYDFSGIGVLVDVAGGHGALITSVLQRYPAMRGVLFDVDHVIEGAVPRIAGVGLAGRCRTEAGDFFKAVPSGGDAYVLKHIVHDWNDERATAILKNVRTAIGKRNGKLILLDAVVQPGNHPDFAKIIDLEMLLLPGGRERTAGDFETLCAGAGFALSGITPTASPVCVIEARAV